MASFADEFLEAAKMLEDEYMIPAIVNIVFSCELYLKELQIKAGIPVKKIHSIKELFENLPIEIQNEIEKNANIRCFNRFIKEIDNAFKEWRYAYQYSPLSISLEDGFRLAYALKKQCDSR